ELWFLLVECHYRPIRYIDDDGAGAKDYDIPFAWRMTVQMVGAHQRHARQGYAQELAFSFIIISYAGEHSLGDEVYFFMVIALQVQRLASANVVLDLDIPSRPIGMPGLELAIFSPVSQQEA